MLRHTRTACFDLEPLESKLLLSAGPAESPQLLGDVGSLEAEPFERIEAVAMRSEAAESGPAFPDLFAGLQGNLHGEAIPADAQATMDPGSPSIEHNPDAGEGQRESGADELLGRSASLAKASSAAQQNRVELLADWSGTIPNGTVWPAGAVQRITDSINVPAGSTLTIEAGAIIKFNGTRLEVFGTLDARGTSSAPIIFTSIHDDTAGGDTNGNGQATVPKAGDWGHVFFRGAGAQGTLSFAEIRFAGSSSADALRLDGNSVAVSDVTVRNVAGTGVYIGTSNTAAFELERLSITDTGRDGLRVSSSSASLNATGLSVKNVKGTAVVVQDAGKWRSTSSSLLGTGVTAISFAGGTILDSRAWSDTVVYSLNGAVTIGATGELTLPAGAVIKADAGGRIEVLGKLSASGTAASPVIFTSIKDDTIGGDTNGNAAANGPSAGDWDRLWARSDRGQLGTVSLDFTELRYGGKTGSSADSAISSSGGALNISNTLIRDSFGEGIWVNSGSAVIIGNRIVNASRYGIRIETAGSAVLTNNSVANATSGAILLRGTGSIAASGNTSTGSGHQDSVVVNDLTISDARLWHENLNYYLLGGITVAASGSLDIAPGRVIKMGAGVRIDVEGTFTAVGTDAAPIVFTSFKDDSSGGDGNQDGAATVPAAGDWDRIYAKGGSVTLERARLRYAGKLAGGSADSAVSAGVGSTSRLSVTNCLIEHSLGEGIWIASGQGQLRNNTITDVGRFGIRIDSNEPSTAEGNSITRAKSGPLRLKVTTPLTASGNTSVGSGLGDAVHVEGGSLTGQQRWNHGLSTYYLAGDLTVNAGASLEIPAGRILKMAPGVRISVSGALLAPGTPAAPIVFTSAKDDTAGGDTNGDGAGSSPAPGDWDRVWVNDRAGKATMQYVHLLYGGKLGGGAGDSSISVSSGGTLELRNSLVQHSFADGVWIANGTATVADTTIRDVAEYGIRIDDTTRRQVFTNNVITTAKQGAVYQKSTSDLDLSGSVWSECGLANAVFVDGGSVNGTRLWRGDTTYWLTDNLMIASGAHLALGAGAVLKFQARDGIQLDGNLTAQGTAANPVLLTSFKDDAGGDTNGDGTATLPAPGDWFSLWHRGGEANLTHTIIAFAGLEPVSTSLAGTPAILTDGGRIMLSEVTVREAFDVGFRTRRSANATVDGLRILNAGLDGISFEGGTVNARRVRLEGIKRYAHTVEPSARWQLSDVNCISAGLKATVVTRNGTVNSSWTLGQLGIVVFQGDDGLEVSNSLNSSLTILPGTILKMPGNFRIEGWNITAAGTAAAPILFTSSKDDRAGGDTNGDGAATAPAPGDWGYLAVNNAASAVAYAEFRYGGLTASTSRSDTALLLNGAPITVRNLVIGDSGGNGIEVINAGSETRIENSLIHGFARYGVRRGPGSNTHLLLVNNTIHGGQVGVRLENVKATLVNNIITGASVAGVQVSSSATYDLTTRYNDVFNPTATNGNYHHTLNANFQARDRVGEISQDPLFVDPAKRIFEPGPGSPVVDAASGDEAPFGDLYDRPRRNDTAVANSGVGFKNYVDIGALEKTSSGTGVDLLITSIRTNFVIPDADPALEFPDPLGDAAPDQVVVTFTIINAGSEGVTAQSLGIDYFLRPASYGVESRTLPDVAIGSTSETLILAPEGEISFTRTLNLPPLWTSPFMVGAKLDTGNQVRETQPVGELNNTFVSPELFLFDNPDVVPGQPVQHDLAQGPWVLDLTPIAPGSKPLALEFQSAFPAIVLFGPSPGLPTDEVYESRLRVPPNLTLSITSPLVGGGTMVVYPDGIAPAPSLFTLKPTLLDHGRLTEVSPRLTGNGGLGTLVFQGGPFASEVTPGLIGPSGQVFTPLTIRHTEGWDEILATFDLTGAPTGAYDAFVDYPGGARSSLGDAVDVMPGGEGNFTVDLLGPDVMRAGLPMPFTLRWANTGLVDTPTRLITVDLPESAHVTFHPNGKRFTDDLALLSLSAYSTNYATLPTQASGSLDFWLTLDAGQPKIDLPVQVLSIDHPFLNTTFELDSILGEIKPAESDSGRWGQMTTALKLALGTSWSEALTELAETANLDPTSFADPAALLSPERIGSYIASGASLLSNLLSDKIAEAYPKPSNPAQGDGIHQDFAIVIAIEDYSASFVGMETITLATGVEVPARPIFNDNLPGTQRDADTWTDYFSNDLNIPGGQITVLRDRAGQADDNLTFDKIRSAWQQTAAKADADDKIKFVYSGHGSSNGGSLIMNTPYNDANDQYVDGAKLKQMFADFPMPGEIYMVFDSCHSQTIGLDLNDVPRLKWNAAVSSNQTAVDGNFWTDSFSDKLIEALNDRGNDRDGDGRVTIDEAYRAAQQAYSADSDATDPEDNRVPRSGGDPSVDQELHDDLGDAARRNTWTNRLLSAVRGGATSLVKSIANVFAIDPNEKVGPSGYGTQQFVPQSELGFTIYFENDPKQSNAAAQVVTITDQLDANLDWSSLRFGTVTFGATTLTLTGTSTHAFAQTYAPLLDVTVSVDAQLDPKTGLVRWVFRTLDPFTKLPTTDPLAGFLPPNTTKPEGEGHVNYTILPKDGLAHATAILNSATIVFDQNDPITTNTTAHTIDAKPPQFVGAVVADGLAQRSTVRWIQFAFKEDTAIRVGLSDFQLVNETTRLPVDLAPAALTLEPASPVARLDLSPLVLTPGNYRLTLKAGSLRDAGGLSLAQEVQVAFHILTGDTNGDRTVNELDLFRVWQQLARAADARDPNADTNGDGQVTVADLNVVRDHYLQRLAPPTLTVALNSSLTKGASTPEVTRPAGAGGSHATQPLESSGMVSAGIEVPQLPARPVDPPRRDRAVSSTLDLVTWGQPEEGSRQEILARATRFGGALVRLVRDN